MTSQTLNLNMIPGGVLPVVHASQYDEQTNAITFKLYNGTSAFTIPSGASVLVQGTKPDITGFSYVAASASGNTVILNVMKQMTAVAGDVACELRIATSSQDVGSCNFILRVERSTLEDDVISETDLPLIQQAAEIAATISEYAETVAQEATAATAAAATATAAAQEASGYNDNVEAIYNSIETAKTNANNAAASANTAATNANAAAATLNNLSATANTLTPGSSATASYSNGVITFGIPAGAKGDRGDSGVLTPLSGFFTMYLDEDSNLYAVSETDLSDAFEYDSTTGNLYYITEDGNV